MWRRRVPRCTIWFDVVVVDKVLDEIDAYCDAVPRSAATVEAHGPFTLFIGSGPWPYYARPARRYLGSITVEDVDMVRARQRDLGVPEAFEWIGEGLTARRGGRRAQWTRRRCASVDGAHGSG